MFWKSFKRTLRREMQKRDEDSKLSMGFPFSGEAYDVPADLAYGRDARTLSPSSPSCNETWLKEISQIVAKKLFPAWS